MKRHLDKLRQSAMADPFLWLLQMRVADTVFAVEASGVHRIVHMASLLKPPGMPDFLHGFLNLGGRAVPVISVAGLLELAGEPVGLYTPLVIVTSDDAMAALLVDGVLSFSQYPTNRLLPVDDTSIFNRCVSRLGMTGDGERFYLLASHRLLLAKEKQTVAEFRMKAQHRLSMLEKNVTAHDESDHDESDHDESE